jgi:APA family basic amino acid/polyamine antiporter
MIMALVVVISTFGCNNGIILSGSRVYYAMASDKLFFKSASQLNNKGVPATSLWIQAVWCSILCLTGSYSQILDYVIFAALIFSMLTIAAVFVMRIKKPDIYRPYKTIGYPILPAIYIIICLLIEVILLLYKRDYTWPGLLFVIAGIPVFYIWRYFQKKSIKIQEKEN